MINQAEAQFSWDTWYIHLSPDFAAEVRAARRPGMEARFGS